MKILILASNPRKDLNLDREIRDLREVIETSRNDLQFEVEEALAVRVGDLQDLLFKHEPQIVHFCGHGGGQPGLVFESNAGGEQWVRTEALQDLFRLFSRTVGCVLLNACYSEEQANEIVKHIDYVIGMNQAIRDDAAIAFSKGFYRALGYACSIEEAYEFGCNAIQLEITGSSIVRSAVPDSIRKADVVKVVATTIIPEHLKPTLKIRTGELTANRWQHQTSTTLSPGKREVLQWELAQELSSQSHADPPPVSPDPMPRRRLTPFLVGSLMVGLLAGVGFYGYHQWPWEPPAQTTLEQAIELSKQEHWEAAIALLNQIRPDDPLSPQAGGYLEAWSTRLFQRAEEYYQKGDIDEAVRLAQAIPATCSIHQQVQTEIAEWNQGKQTLDEIKRILDTACDRGGSNRLLKQLNSPGLQKQAEDLIKENEQKCPPPPSIPPALENDPQPQEKPDPSENPGSHSTTSPLQQNEVEPVFREFIAAWNSGDYTSQLDLIAKADFTSESYKIETGERYAHHNYSEYANLRASFTKNYAWIKVEVSDEQFIPLNNDEMLVKYSQHYDSPNYESWGTNELYFRRQNGTIKIIKEVFNRNRVIKR